MTLTDTERVRAVLTTTPQTIPQLQHHLPGMRTEDIDAALMELNRQGAATFSTPDADFFGLMTWAAAQRPR